MVQLTIILLNALNFETDLTFNLGRCLRPLGAGASVVTQDLVNGVHGHYHYHHHYHHHHHHLINGVHGRQLGVAPDVQHRGHLGG